jgi:hypothetical protein
VEDILIYSATDEEHVEAVRALLTRAAAQNVAINMQKSDRQTAVTFG